MVVWGPDSSDVDLMNAHISASCILFFRIF